MAQTPAGPGRHVADSSDDEEQKRSAENSDTDASPPVEDKAVKSKHGEKKNKRPNIWTFGILADEYTDEVPGSVLLLSKPSEHNAPLGLQNVPARRSESSLRSTVSASSRSRAMFGQPTPRTPRTPLTPAPETKKTKDGKIILEPQPDESLNDPLNWTVFRRDAALLSLGFYCMVGGGMTTILAAGFTNVSETYHVSIPQVALTTGLYMMGLGVGSVIASPTAIAFGKRPVYLVASLLFLLTSIWCALSPTYSSLVVARVIQGIAVSPVECLPSATIAEIFFLHERAYRLGIYTLLLLGGKNLVPLVSAAIIQSLSWQWVFWILSIIVGFCFCLLFFFVPETFWDRSPRPHKPHRKPSFSGLRKITSPRLSRTSQPAVREPISDEIVQDLEKNIPNIELPAPTAMPGNIAKRRRERHAHFVTGNVQVEDFESNTPTTNDVPFDGREAQEEPTEEELASRPQPPQSVPGTPGYHKEAWRVTPEGGAPLTPQLRNLNSPWYESKGEDYFAQQPQRSSTAETAENVKSPSAFSSTQVPGETPIQYTRYYQNREPKTFVETLKPYSGRLTHDNWFRVAARPFVLFLYPAILWSAAIYALSVGWLIVLSESVATIFRDPQTYNFDAIGTGLIYISPFVGGVLGTAVAGKVSDLIVRFVSRRNDGIYEPEFRLIMAIPVAISTTIGLMGYGWSAAERDNFWVPTIFFGIISFGCTLGSTTAITFAVDSYRQYAGEALVTLNFSKNIFHGLVFSLFFNSWLESEGPKDVFLALGGIQLFFLLLTIPMYIFGKRARMWTVRRNLMENF